MSITINQGTQTTVASGLVGGTETPIFRLDKGAGTTASLFSGTLAEITNLAGGTIVNNGGSVQLNSTPLVLGTPTHTRGTTGAAVWGTLVAAAGAGTKQYVSHLDIVVTSGTVDVAITNIGIGGSTGAGVLARGQFPAGGGITKPLNPVIASATNGTLAYWLGGAGTVDMVITYWQGV